MVQTQALETPCRKRAMSSMGYVVDSINSRLAAIDAMVPRSIGSLLCLILSPSHPNIGDPAVIMLECNSFLKRVGACALHSRPTAYRATRMPVSLDVISMFAVMAVDLEWSVQSLSRFLMRATINGDSGNRMECTNVYVDEADQYKKHNVESHWHTLVNKPTAAVQNTKILLDLYLNNSGNLVFCTVAVDEGTDDVSVSVLTDNDTCE